MNKWKVMFWVGLTIGIALYVWTLMEAGNGG